MFRLYKREYTKAGSTSEASESVEDFLENVNYSASENQVNQSLFPSQVNYRRASEPYWTADEWSLINHHNQMVLRAPAKNTFRSDSKDSHQGNFRRREKSVQISSQNLSMEMLPQPSRPSKLRAGERKLVLHFDARNTVFVADLFSRISVEHALNTYIAGVVWGVQNPDSSWECISRQPTLQKPQSNAVSLYKVTEAQLVKKPEDRAILRQVLGNFTQTPAGAPFANLFHKHLKILQWPYPVIDAKLTVTGLDGQPYHYLLPAFYELIKELFISGRDFCVLVRTFGRDAPHILSAVRRFSMGLHPRYPGCFPLPVRKEEEVFKCSEDGLVYTYINESGVKVQLTSGEEIYEHWNSSYGVVGVVDDFEYWQNHHYHYSASKPLWLDPEDDYHVHHIMFDDNIRMEDDDNIINLRLLENRENRTEGAQGTSSEKLLTPQEGLGYSNVNYVQADLLECIRNPDYFIEMINQCEDNLDKQKLISSGKGDILMNSTDAGNQ